MGKMRSHRDSPFWKAWTAYWDQHVLQDKTPEEQQEAYNEFTTQWNKNN